MLKDILDEKIYNIITTKFNYGYLNEIRLRVNNPIVVYVKGQAYFLGENGLTTQENSAIIVTKQMIEDIIFRASEFSIYSINEELKKGYIVLKGGERLGICGTIVSENGEIKTLNKFTSINIRIPHEIKNCSLDAFSFLVDDEGLKNTLVISPPGAGKTTFIRDFVNQLSLRNLSYNVLILDERGEIAGEAKELSVGKFTDVLSFCTKKNGFMQGIRSMSPHIIVTDEIGDFEDILAVKFAGYCGVKVMATIHANNIEDLKYKDGWQDIKNIFERYVVLSKRNGPGTIEGVYGEDFSRLAIWR